MNKKLTAEQLAKRKKYNKIVLGLLFLVIVIASLSQTDEEVIEYEKVELHRVPVIIQKQLDSVVAKWGGYIINKQYDEMVALLQPSFAQRKTQKYNADFIKNIYEYENIKTIKSIDIETRVNGIFYIYRLLIITQEATYTTQLNLIKENGKWVINPLAAYLKPIKKDMTNIKERVKQYFISNEEPRVKDAIWSDKKVFKIGVIDDGSSRDGYAQYVCTILKGHKLKNILVRVIDYQKVIDGEWVNLGTAHCK